MQAAIIHRTEPFDLIDRLHVSCNDGLNTTIQFDAIWRLKSFDPVLYICHCAADGQDMEKTEF